MDRDLREFTGDKFFSKCEIFADILLEYNKIHNVSGIKTRDDVFENILDSIYPVRFLDLKDIKNAVDIGTGAGFPGLILALYLPEVSFTLFEPILKKSAFLHLAKSKLGLKNVTIKSQRVEKSEPFEADLITSRAVSDAKFLMTLTKEYITPKTLMLLYKGSEVEKELSEIENYDIIQKGKRRYLVVRFDSKFKP